MADPKYCYLSKGSDVRRVLVEEGAAFEAFCEQARASGYTVRDDADVNVVSRYADIVLKNIAKEEDLQILAAKKTATKAVAKATAKPAAKKPAAKKKGR